MRARVEMVFALWCGGLCVGLGGGLFGGWSPLVETAAAQSGSVQTQPSKPSTSTSNTSSTSSASSNTSARTYVVILPGSKEYHWPSCPLVLKPPSGTNVLFRGEANRKGFTPHKDCDPANASAATDAAGAAPGEPVYVYVAKSDTKYHRGDCKVLPRDAARTLLDRNAVRGRWPCTVCRPPIRPAPKPAFQR